MVPAFGGVETVAIPGRMTWPSPKSPFPPSLPTKRNQSQNFVGHARASLPPLGKHPTCGAFTGRTQPFERLHKEGMRNPLVNGGQ